MLETLLLENPLLWGSGGAGLLLAAVLAYFLKKKKLPKQALPETKSADPAEQTKKASGPSWWSALEKSRSRFLSFGKNPEIEALKEEIEEACLLSDLGVQSTQEALNSIDWNAVKALPAEKRAAHVREELSSLFSSWLHHKGKTLEKDWPLNIEKNEPHVILFVGVNGVGKTTSIAKLARELTEKGKSVMLAAGDTFRAAASEQLEVWANRLNIRCIKGGDGADSSSVLFDALKAAQAQKVDYLLCDSAGRLHNQKQLMEALQKNLRVMNKAQEGAPHETLLVLDAHTGQNMGIQAEQFQGAVQATGLILTKLDGSAKGGAVVSIVKKTELPVYRLGLGEAAEDFAPFNPEDFSKALLGLENAPS